MASGTLRGMIQAIIPREVDQNSRAALRCGLKSPEILHLKAVEIEINQHRTPPREKKMDCSLLDQLQFLNSLQRLTHGECIAVV